MLLVACGNFADEKNNSPEPLFSQPFSADFNDQQGYVINPLTGDSIQPLILATGDTLKSGVAVEVAGYKVPPESVLPPKVIRAGRPEKVAANTNMTKAAEPEIVKAIPLAPVMDSVHFTINSSGDTLPTGVPIPVQGKTLPAKYPSPVIAMPPRYKDNNSRSIQYLDVDQGMASSYIRKMTQDRKGHIWFATWGGGVSRYDGTAFTHFTEEQGLSSNLIWEVMEDKAGNIWMGTEGGGVNMYDGVNITQFTETEGLVNNYVFDILEDSKGNIWMSTYGGLTMYDGKSFIHYTEKEGLASNNTHRLFEDSKGNIWIGTSNRGVSMFDGTSFSNFSKSEGLCDNNAKDFLEDEQGQIWIATYGGISIYDGQSFSNYKEEHGMCSAFAQSIWRSENGNIWIGTYGGGLVRFDGKNFTCFAEEQGMTMNNLGDILVDDAGNIWIATYGGGVNIYNEAFFTHYTEKQGLNNAYVWSIMQGVKDQIWFGTDNGGVNIFDGNSFSYLTENEGLPMNFVVSMIKDEKGEAWFGTFGNGVGHYSGSSFTQFTEENGLSNDKVVSLLKSRKGDIWIATYTNGLSIYDGQSFTHYTEKEGLSSNSVTCLLETKNGDIWIGTVDSGVGVFDGKNFKFITEKEGLGHNHVWAIEEDKNGDIWIGTFGGGLTRFDGKSFTYITEDHGLSNNIVWSIKEDMEGKLWVGTDKGLNVIERNSSKMEASEAEQFEIHKFGKQDGLKGLDFYGNSVFLDSHNQMWWGTGKSVVMLDLDNFSIAEEPPRLQLDHLLINEKFYDFRSIKDSKGIGINFESVPPFSNFPEKLDLHFRKNHLTFFFAGIDWNAPHKILYSHRILGLDDNWSIPSSEAKADYRNIPYGTYTFQARAIGESQEWTAPLEYTFNILPPWWHTWWARGIYALLALSGIMFYVRWRTATLKQNQKKLEKTVRQRTAEVVLEKERSDELLLNILPFEIAEELKSKGSADAQLIDQVTVIFTDFKGFTAMSEKMSPRELVHDLHECFSAFDEIIEKHGLEKIKTIGDSYMAAGGLPTPNNTHAVQVTRAALEIRDFIAEGKAKKISAGLPYFEIRIGLHTGPVVAGIVGVKKFQYDIWGDTVNTASRMESACEVGKVNISQATYEMLQPGNGFSFESRGKVQVKGKGEVDMWFVENKT